MKLLIGGNNRAAIDSIFAYSGPNYECLTTSSRIKDIKGHLNYYVPDAFVYCAKDMTKERAIGVRAFREYLREKRIPFIALGSKEDIEVFDEISKSFIDMAIVRPYDTARLRIDIENYIKEYRIKPSGEAIDADNSDEEREQLEQLINKTAPNENKKRVLIIDDDAVMLKTVKRYLEDEFEVATSLNGKLALKYLEKKSVDIILLDYEMPQMNGTDVLMALRESKRTSDIPVVFLTGVSDPGKIQKILEMRVAGYLFKPADNKKLHELIYELLD